jgi:hypothetical protein
MMWRPFLDLRFSREHIRCKSVCCKVRRGFCISRACQSRLNDVLVAFEGVGEFLTVVEGGNVSAKGQVV